MHKNRQYRIVETNRFFKKYELEYRDYHFAYKTFCIKGKPVRFWSQDAAYNYCKKVLGKEFVLYLPSSWSRGKKVEL